MDCIFCKLANKEIPTQVLYEDDEVFCFSDMDPQAPTHFLVIPKKHIEGLHEGKEEDQELLGKLLLTAASVAERLGLENGYRVVTNSKEDGGQTVNHLHFHVLGGRKMTWPPG